MHSQTGRLHADAVSPQKIGWAVCGNSAFVRQAVPAMRKAGMNVAALSVTPESGNFHNVMDKLKAQDAADRVASQLQVDLPRHRHGAIPLVHSAARDAEGGG